LEKETVIEIHSSVRIAVYDQERNKHIYKVNCQRNNWQNLPGKIDLFDQVSLISDGAKPL